MHSCISLLHGVEPFSYCISHFFSSLETWLAAENLEQWLKEVQMYSPGGGEAVIKLLVGNKCDLDRKVSPKCAQ